MKNCVFSIFGELCFFEGKNKSGNILIIFNISFLDSWNINISRMKILCTVQRLPGNHRHTKPLEKAKKYYSISHFCVFVMKLEKLGVSRQVDLWHNFEIFCFSDILSKVNFGLQLDTVGVEKGERMRNRWKTYKNSKMMTCRFQVGISDLPFIYPASDFDSSSSSSYILSHFSFIHFPPVSLPYIWFVCISFHQAKLNLRFSLAALFWLGSLEIIIIINLHSTFIKCLFDCFDVIYREFIFVNFHFISPRLFFCSSHINLSTYFLSRLSPFCLGSSDVDASSYATCIITISYSNKLWVACLTFLSFYSFIHFTQCRCDSRSFATNDSFSFYYYYFLLSSSFGYFYFFTLPQSMMMTMMSWNKNIRGSPLALWQIPNSKILSDCLSDGISHSNSVLCFFGYVCWKIIVLFL